ncbi:MAG TPA: rod shape-determining protein RodA [Steroidobacteraceae bacterium]|jgi:rod shape determining protein RodA|nr:rod shape-determining protein RodA [Steroidobacteraceae bacterium]
MIYDDLQPSTARRTLTASARLLGKLRLDGPLLLAICATAVFGLVILYSASGENLALTRGQFLRMILGLIMLVLLAQASPKYLRMSAPWIYALGIVLLVIVAVIGDIGKGAQRWLDLGLLRFQPSEIMKLAVPMACAWFLHERPLPPDLKVVLVLGLLVLFPVGLIAEQPDLGTALLIAASGLLVVLLAGLRLRVIIGVLALLPALAWVGWGMLHDYQRKRVLTFLTPESDPLGAGYHIIQSQIALGSGGVFGKGWMNGSQAQLEFLPERSTDFIFAVAGEEFGLIGLMLLLGLYLFIIGRGMYLAMQCQDTFSRLVAGSISLTFFVYVIVNAGMVSGLLPVVGVPLPLVSYGGTSMVTLMAGFGILMSLHSHRKLVGS